jgi:OOP family OmpA-OmpF porin
MRTILPIFAFFFALTAGDAFAVNLVPNNSFEAYAPCPSGLSQINQAPPWNTPTGASPDLFNSCASGGSGMSVPSNFFGSQNALTGAGYAGIIVRPINEFREYIQAPLASALTAGVTYAVTFNVSLCDLSNIALDRIGAYLSVGAVGPLPGTGALGFVPQIENPAGSFLADKTNWMTVTGSFIAAGGEDHIVIGNFHDNTNTSITPLTGSYDGVYYYVDDVSVESSTPTDEACCLSDGTCQLLLASECSLAGGTPQGPGTNCGPAGCNPVPVLPVSWGSVKARVR